MSTHWHDTSSEYQQLQFLWRKRPAINIFMEKKEKTIGLINTTKIPSLIE